VDFHYSTFLHCLWTFLGSFDDATRLEILIDMKRIETIQGSFANYVTILGGRGVDEFVTVQTQYFSFVKKICDKGGGVRESRFFTWRDLRTTPHIQKLAVMDSIQASANIFIFLKQLFVEGWNIWFPKYLWHWNVSVRNKRKLFMLLESFLFWSFVFHLLYFIILQYKTTVLYFSIFGTLFFESEKIMFESHLFTFLKLNFIPLFFALFDVIELF